MNTPNNILTLCYPRRYIMCISTVVYYKCIFVVCVNIDECSQVKQLYRNTFMVSNEKKKMKTGTNDMCMQWYYNYLEYQTSSLEFARTTTKALPTQFLIEAGLYIVGRSEVPCTEANQFQKNVFLQQMKLFRIMLIYDKKYVSTKCA